MSLNGLRGPMFVVASFSIAGTAGCSTVLDFDHFSGGSDGGGIDGSRDAMVLDAPGHDAPGHDAPGSDSPATPMHTLTVALTGAGMVASSPTGITCGTTCSADFADGTLVTLTATPDATTSFVSWGGACAGTGPTCMVTISAAASVTARFALHGAVRWVDQLADADSYENDVVVGPDGNPILGTVANDGTDDSLFVAKFDRNTGATIWTQRLTTTGLGASFGGIAVGPDGEVYATIALASFFGTGGFTAGGTTFSGDGYGNIGTFRLSGTTGAVVWGVQWGGAGQDRPSGIAVSGTNLYVVGGSSSSTGTFGSLTQSGSIDNGFLVQASTATGAATHITLLSGTFTQLAVAANATNVAVVGSVLSPTATSGACSYHPTGAGGDMFIASFNATNLSCAWSRTAGDSVANNSAAANTVAPQPDGGWVVGGGFRGSVLWNTGGGSPLVSHGDYDAFLVRYTPAGTHVWSFRYGGASFDGVSSLATTPTGETFVTGYFHDSIVFGVTTLTGPADVFVTRMSAGTAPIHDWAVTLGGDSGDQSRGLGVDAAGNAYVAAYFTSMTVVGGMPFTATGTDTWIAALAR